MAFFNTPEINKKYERIGTEYKDGIKTTKYKYGNLTITVTSNKPSEPAIKRFAHTLNDIVTDIASNKTSA